MMRFSNERVIAISRNLFTNPPEFRKLFGDYKFCSPVRLPVLSLAEIKRNGFDRIIFANPYSHGDIERLYCECRVNGFPFLVCERGALPGTVFLDETGFLADSSLYDRRHWRDLEGTDVPHSLAELRLKYLSRPDLEQQATRYRSFAKPKSRRSRPRILLALQDSGDTAVRAFAEADQTYWDFLRFIEQLCSTYGAEIEFVYKPHPREPGRQVSGAASVAHLHIIDALEQVDAVITYGSGVGVLAMLMGRPVGFFGVPFYRHSGAAQHVAENTAFEQFIATLGNKRLQVEASRFLTHLSRLYSDVDFFGRKWNRKGGRDVLCRYRTIRFMDSSGHYEQQVICRRTHPLSWIEPFTRLFKNHTGISGDNW